MSLGKGMSYFQFEGHNIYYSSQGSGPPLLLLHGNTASSRMYAELATAYAEDFQVICLDFLGHGDSERLAEFPTDLWYYEARQVLAFLEQKQYRQVNLIGSSGGALVAINAGLAAPTRIRRVIADSFEGETPLPAFTANVVAEREQSKQDAGARAFYQAMQGADWEQVVDNDTAAIARHAREGGRFFHGDLRGFRPELLLTGSLEDEYLRAVSPTFFADTYGAMLARIGHGAMHLFPHGGHPAMFSNAAEFLALSRAFFR